MAERERLSNKQRRANAREQRRRAEAEAAQKRKKNQLRTGLVTFVVVGVIAVLLFAAFAPGLFGGPETLDDTVLISASEAEDAREAAGCEMLVERQPLPDATHMETPPGELSSVYTDTRPTHSGPHTPQVHPVIGDSDRQIDEFNSTHNLEHGSIIVWWDPEQAEAASDDLGSWAETLNESGFSGSQKAQGGIGILSAPYEDPGLDGDTAVAFRAWGTAMNCEQWDETVANSFVIENYGTHGIAPERAPATYPTDVLAYEDADVADTSEEDAPLNEGTDGQDMEVAEDEAAEQTTEDAGDGTGGGGE